MLNGWLRVAPTSAISARREKQVPTPAEGTVPARLSRTTISLPWLSANSSM